MSLIFSLPDDIIHCLFGEWLELMQWYRMDCVMISHKRRPELLQVFATTVCTRLIHFYFENKITWIESRNIRFRSMELSRKRKTSLDMTSVEMLTIYSNYCNEPTIVQTINACPQLQSLQLYITNMSIDYINVKTL